MPEYRRVVGSTQNMKYQMRKNYGGIFRIGSETLPCYTKKQMQSLYPAGDYKIVGEFTANSKASPIGMLKGERELPFFPYKSQNRVLLREKGYLALEEREDEYIVLLQMVLPRRIAMLSICVILAVCGTLLTMQLTNTVTLQESSVPAAVAPNLDSNAVDWQGVQSTATGSVTPGIAIPGFKSITIDANSTDAKVNFSNPEGNPCYFEISLELENGTVLFKSNMIKPGQGIYDIQLSQELDAGTYDAIIKYDTFSLEGLSPMNGAEVKIQLIAQ